MKKKETKKMVKQIGTLHRYKKRVLREDNQTTLRIIS